MSLVRFNSHLNPFEEMEQMLSHFPSLIKSNRGVPELDMYEEGNNLMVEVNLPGVNPKDIEVHVENGILTIKGEHKKTHEIDDRPKYYHKETRSGSFFRQVALPLPVSEERVQAESEGGVLRITCPKQTPTKVKKIEVKVQPKKK
jgi:HSP20 family protein